MLVKPRENRVPIMLSDEELAAIDDWRFANRVSTRSDAIRRLCRMGIESSTLISETKEDVDYVIKNIDVVLSKFYELAEQEVDVDATYEAIGYLLPEIVSIAVKHSHLWAVNLSMKTGKSIDVALESSNALTESFKENPITRQLIDRRQAERGIRELAKEWKSDLLPRGEDPSQKSYEDFKAWAFAQGHQARFEFHTVFGVDDDAQRWLIQELSTGN